METSWPWGGGGMGSSCRMYVAFCMRLFFDFRIGSVDKMFCRSKWHLCKWMHKESCMALLIPAHIHTAMHTLTLSRTFLSQAQPFLLSWCFEPSQPQRITSGLNTNLTLSPSYSFHKSSYHKSCFWAYLYSEGTQHRNLHLAGWPILFYGPTQEPCVRHSEHRRNWEKFWQKSRWMDRKGRNKQGRNPWQ